MQMDDAVNILPLNIVQKLEEAGIPQDSFIFYQNDRWVYRIRHPVSIPREELHCQMLDSLGPFETHAVDISLFLSPSESQYTITEIRKQQIPIPHQIKARHAPISQITLEGFARSIANIPENATYFCWLYPPYNLLNNINFRLNDSNESNLLKIGGFAYFIRDTNNGNNFRLIRVNSLVESAVNGLTFDGPYPWRKEYTNRLWTENRFQPVTLPSLQKLGARYFAFINPYEYLTSDSDNISWLLSPHGAFVYIFNEGHSPHAFDSYFTVADDCLGVAPND